MKTIVITGASSGIGLEMAKKLAKMDRENQVIIIGRNIAKTELALKKIQDFSQNKNVDYLLADLSLLSNIRNVVSEFKSKYKHLDILINNAGVYLPTKMVTVEGLEMTIATNYYCPFLLTNLLIDNLRLSPQARIVNVSSGAYN